VTANDYKIHALIRALLVRRGIDLVKLEHGVTNGVVYLSGGLVSYLTTRTDDTAEIKVREAELANSLERTIRQIPGVRDVLFKLDRVVKVGWRWRPR
jgi:hypothetical protein